MRKRASAGRPRVLRCGLFSVRRRRGRKERRKSAGGGLQRRGRRVAGRVFLCLAAALAALASAPAAGDELTGKKIAQLLEQAVEEAIARAEPSVVAIARVRKDDPASDEERMSPDFVPNEFGSGVVIDRQGFILTNYHVLGDLQKYDYYVWANRRPYKAKAAVRAADPWMDLAVLRVEANDFKPIVFGDAEHLKKGQMVIALGNPYATARDGRPSASWGIISNLSRKAPHFGKPDERDEHRETLHEYGTLIQTDVRLPLGTSGGALLNLDGEMIGLTTSLAALAGYETSAGFAIPMDQHVRRTIRTLQAGRRAEYGFLGVAPEHLAAADRRKGLFGARVASVVPGAPAAQADLRAGDIITRVDGAPVADRDELIRDISRTPVGTRMVLAIRRGADGAGGGRTLRKPVVLAKKYLDSARPPFAVNDPPPWRGLVVDYATAIPPALFRERAMEIDPGGCVAVVRVAPDSPAWAAGLREGVFISFVEDRRVASPQDFYDAVAGATGPVRVQLAGRRGEDSLRTIGP